MGNCVITGPNEAVVVSGGCFSNEPTVVVGGWAWACWGVTNVSRLPLNVITLLPKCEKVETRHGVALTVTGVAQVAVISANHMDGNAQDRTQRDQFLLKALEAFLGKNETQIRDTILQTMEGHLRAILGTLSVEEIYQDRENFARLVREHASPDVAKMGLEIISFTIKDVADHVMYLDSLGKKQTANVVRDADIGKAEALRDSGIEEAKCDRARMGEKFAADTAIANSKREFDLKKAGFQEEVNQKNAEAELAYQLQAAKVRQLIRSEEIEIEVVERRRQIQVEEQEVLRKEKELIANVNRPAEAEKFKVETLAQAQRTNSVAVATGEAEGIKYIGAAESARIRAIGEADANAMKRRAQAYKDYGKAAVTSLIMDALPKIAAEISAPLSRTQEIVLISGKSAGGSNITNDINHLAGSLQPAIQTLTGVNIASALQTLAGQSKA